jgi:hypothetical protein
MQEENKQSAQTPLLANQGAKKAGNMTNKGKSTPPPSPQSSTSSFDSEQRELEADILDLLDRMSARDYGPPPFPPPNYPPPPPPTRRRAQEPARHELSRQESARQNSTRQEPAQSRQTSAAAT